MPSSFADRLWWARHAAGLGATRLAKLAGCAQSLISHIERTNAEKSHFSNKFAHALKVDPTWLAHGVKDRAPAGFDEDAARRGRENPNKTTAPIIRLPAPRPANPRWAEPADSEPEPLSPLTGADAMMKQLIAAFMDFARFAGKARATALLTTLSHVADLMSVENGAGQNNVVGGTNQGHDGA